MDDFFTFLQLFVIFMISSGVAITAVLYPHYPLGLDLFTKAFVFRGLMALFSSEIVGFKKSTSILFNQRYESSRKVNMLVFVYHMVYLSNVRTKLFFIFINPFSRSSEDDNLYAYNRYGITSPRCNQTSWIAWFLLIQYFFLAKRFLTSLLTAMFG